MCFPCWLNSSTGRKTSPAHQCQIRELTWENKWNSEPVFVHLPWLRVLFPSYHDREALWLKSGWETGALHTTVHTKGRGNKRRPCQREGTQSKRKSVPEPQGRLHPSPLSAHPLPIQTGHLWTPTSDGAEKRWGSTIHWLSTKTVMARPTPAQEGGQAHTNVCFSWAEVSLLFCSPKEHRIFSAGPGICATAIWDIQSSKNWFPSITSWLKTNLPLEGSRHLPVLLAWNLHESMVRKQPYQIPAGLWGGTTKDREPAVKDSKREKARQWCNQDMGKKGFPMKQLQDEWAKRLNGKQWQLLVKDWFGILPRRAVLQRLGNRGPTDDSSGAPPLSAQEIVTNR